MFLESFNRFYQIIRIPAASMSGDKISVERPKGLQDVLTRRFICFFICKNRIIARFN
uniref:Uncharacterized protein n=1 Tax=uncultured marine virus TaxID=186617 RepID=A0A0F7L0M6_9VIRU|nr:hypothetical protein [uncultured marine virus]